MLRAGAGAGAGAGGGSDNETSVRNAIFADRKPPSAGTPGRD